MAEVLGRRRSVLGVVLRAIAREFSRIRLTVWILIVMFVTMIVGSIFPQGYDPETYISSWGEAKYIAFAKLGFLNLFHSKFFLILGAILFVNLVVCSILRWSARRGAGLAGASPPAHAREFLIKGDERDALARAAGVLEACGFRVLSRAGNVLTARRGPWPEGVSLLYHLALALAIVGFIISALTSFEGDATIWPGETVTVATVSSETGAYRMGSALADWHIGAWHPLAAARPDTTEWPGREIGITLNEFVTEWELYNDKYYPRDWMSDVVIDSPAGERRVNIEVNRPFRVEGLTFYQMAYEQEFDVVVLSGGVEVERAGAQAYAPFTLESIGGMFFPGTMRVGTLYQKYHDPAPVVPHVNLKWQAPVAEADSLAEEAAPPERVELGDLSAGIPLDVEGHSLLLENPREATVLSYRRDRGVAFLYIAITAFIVGLCLRTYWPSYRVNLWITGGDGRTRGRLVMRATGMLGEPEEIEDSIVRDLRTG